MKALKGVALATSLLGSLALTVPSLAQFGTTHVASHVGTAGVTPKNSEIYIYPGTTFIVSGLPAPGSSSAAVSGILAGLDTGTATKDDRFAVSVGGWYWYHDSHSEAYEFHIKGFYRRTYGLQFGILGPQVGGGDSPFDGFFVYNLELKRGARSPIGLQFGLGFFDDPSLQRTTVGGSAFVQASYEILQNLDLNFSYWYVNTHDQDLHRIAAGVGLRF